MKYPSMNEFINNNFDFNVDEDSPVEKTFEMVASCIDVVYDEEDVWSASDCTKKELNDWVDSLNSQQFKEIEKFFETMPKLAHTIKVTNPKTNVESEVVLEGLSSFFE